MMLPGNFPEGCQEPVDIFFSVLYADANPDDTRKLHFGEKQDDQTLNLLQDGRNM